MHFFAERLQANDLTWYTISVRAGREQKIRDLIMNQESELGLKDIVVPEPVAKKHTDELDRYTYLLGYIFVKLVLDIDRYHVLLQIDDTFRFLGNLYYIEELKRHFYIPAPIPEKQIRNVREYLAGALKFVVPKSDKLTIGDEVEIKSGDLASVRGTIANISKNYVSIITKSFFNQLIKVPIEKVAACKEHIFG